MARKSTRSLTLWSWAFYDWANTGFALVVMTALFPVFFGDYWAGEMADDQSTFWFGLGASIAGAITAVAAPFIGALGDVRAQRKVFLLGLTVLGVATTAVMFLIGKGQWAFALTAYVVAVVAFSTGNLFYDSLLRGITTRDNRHFVSAAGFSLGYFGSTFLLIGSLWMVQSPETFGLSDTTQATRVAFLITAAWWLVFSLPLAFFVPEPPGVEAEDDSPILRRSLVELWGTLKAAWRRPALRYFLIAFFFYVDGINTVSKMALKLGQDIGFDRGELLTGLVIAQFTGVPFTLLFGFLGQRFGTRYILFGGIGIYLIVLIYASQMSGEAFQFLGISVLPIYMLGFLIGMAHGGMLSLSRSFYSNLIPEEKAGAFFGLYNILGKASSIMGPVFVGGVTLLAGDTRTGVLALSLFFVAGAAFLVPATRSENVSEAER